MKSQINEVGDLSPGNAQIAIVAARFNSNIVNNLLEGATDTLVKHGIRKSNIKVVYVPGAFEIPLAAMHLVDSEQEYNAIITLGCVIQGDTPHFDFVAGECARGVMDVSLSTGIPVIFGVLTTNTLEQAQLRSQASGENKGVDCALCALEMCNVINSIREQS
ncbi:MAG: 6,7-dimethyl-8-ribityllumazine synthase [Gammaproteobacteria bacterium]|nr:6,7-dimethyl-8-ribityllumazine synthase [Gammaproteobacteria bacterium]